MRCSWFESTWTYKDNGLMLLWLSTNLITINRHNPLPSAHKTEEAVKNGTKRVFHHYLFYIDVEETGLSRHIWDVEHVGSNPTIYTIR